MKKKLRARECNKENNKNKINFTGLNLETFMINLRKLLQKLWKATLKSDLYAKDKAEILRLLIFAFTIIFITALFVLYRL